MTLNVLLYCATFQSEDVTRARRMRPVYDGSMDFIAIPIKMTELLGIFLMWSSTPV